MYYFHSFTDSILTLFKNENEWQKTKQVPIPLLRASRNFPVVKTRNKNQMDLGDNPIYPFWVSSYPVMTKVS